MKLFVRRIYFLTVFYAVFPVYGNIQALAYSGEISGRDFSSAQEINQERVTVRGKVVDEDGQPIPSATVIAKGASNGTVTNGNGVYEISVTDAGATLVFSFIGLEKK